MRGGQAVLLGGAAVEDLATRGHCVLSQWYSYQEAPHTASQTWDTAGALGQDLLFGLQTIRSLQVLLNPRVT